MPKFGIQKKFRDKYQIIYRACQGYPECPNKPFKAYLKATRSPHGYLLLDIAQDTDDRLRFRTCIFPVEYPPTFYVNVINETDKSNYHALLVLKIAQPKLRKALISNCNPLHLNCISECILMVLNGNLNVSASAFQIYGSIN
jgi:hypothetical protein